MAEVSNFLACGGQVRPEPTNMNLAQTMVRSLAANNCGRISRTDHWPGGRVVAGSVTADAGLRRRLVRLSYQAISKCVFVIRLREASHACNCAREFRDAQAAFAMSRFPRRLIARPR